MIFSIGDHYSPLPSQKKFHANKSKIRLASGGVRSGKTLSGAWEFLALCLENPGCDLAIIAPTYKILHSVTVREFRKVLSFFNGIVAAESKQQEYMDLKNGVRIYLRSAENPEGFEGLTLAGFWGDEARYWRKAAWEILLARLSSPKARALRGIITTTPAMNWLYDEFCSDLPGREIVRFRTDQNIHLPSDYIEGLKRSYSEQRFRQYVLGEFVQLEGSCFPEFSENVHVGSLPVDPRAPVDCCVDPGVQRAAVGYFQYFEYCSLHSRSECIHQVDEDMPDNTPTWKLVGLVTAKYAREGWRRGDLFIDPAARARSVQTGIPDVHLFEDANFRVRYTTDPLQTYIPNGIELIQRKLRDANGGTSLFLSSKMLAQKRGAIRSLQASSYPRTREDQPEGDRPVKDGFYEHARDMLRYYLINKVGVLSAKIRPL